MLNTVKLVMLKHQDDQPGCLGKSHWAVVKIFKGGRFLRMYINQNLLELFMISVKQHPSIGDYPVKAPLVSDKTDTDLPSMLSLKS